MTKEVYDLVGQAIRWVRKLEGRGTSSNQLGTGAVCTYCGSEHIPGYILQCF